MRSWDGPLLSVSGALLAVLACDADETRVVIESDGWQLVGDLVLPQDPRPAPAVLMLNQADGTRAAYEGLARLLAERGIASLRIDLRAHGESTNLGRFVPGDVTLLAGSERDVVVAHEFLRDHAAIDGDRVGVIGSSYSGESMAEAGRSYRYAQAYVALSPGSFSDLPERVASWLAARL